MLRYAAATGFGESLDGRPAIWCFDRFGQTLTRLPDGRFIEIGGEHEDFYDPDFCIYNDVVLHHGDGTFDIFGYPEAVFPPTDFHTATLLGGWIYIIGRLGYTHGRVAGLTAVYRLNVESLMIEEVTCRGAMPGWIYKHKARLVCGSQVEVAGGEIFENGDCRPNNKVYRLDVVTRRWEEC